jgi:hypothetical protein
MGGAGEQGEARKAGPGSGERAGAMGEAGKAVRGSEGFARQRRRGQAVRCGMDAMGEAEKVGKAMQSNGAGGEGFAQPRRRVER